MPETDRRRGDSPAVDAQEFADLFGATYLRFHRRDGKRNELSGASRAVLMHLSQTGPLPIGEIARHLDRAQSVVSEIVTGLEQRGMLEREPDPADRRRTLVWLSQAGFELLAADRNVLSTGLLTDALALLSAERRTALLVGLRELVATQPNPR